MAQKKNHQTTDFGAPIADDNTSETLGRGGPVLMQDVVLLDKLSHFDRERIPERVVHAKGAGAFGWFECSADLSQYTCAKLFAPGKRTEVLARFSTVAGERGSADAERDPRGFALKFYTEDGIYDLVGNNTPIFFVRDTMKFPDFIHSQKRMSHNNLRSAAAMWDFWSLTPESLHQVVILMSERGIPATFRHMNGYSSHAYMWYNAKGEYVWVKYHFKTEQGIKNLTREEATDMIARDRDHATRDLFTAIEAKHYPAWRVEVQIMTPEQAEHFPYDPFDVTKVWPHGLIPTIAIGRLVLDRNPVNYFEQIEQAAFNPSNFVPGIHASPDKMLQGRLFSYHDTHLHRLGPNYHRIPVNMPKHPAVANYHRDGFHATGGPEGPAPNYWPNSMGGPAPATDVPGPPQVAYSGETGRYVQPVGPIDYEQPAALYANVMTDQDRERLVGNIIDHMHDVPKRIQKRSCVMFWKMSPDCGRRIAQGLKLNLEEIEKLAQLRDEELRKATAK